MTRYYSLPRITERELHTILAALRSWKQDEVDARFRHVPGVKPLTPKEVDELCEKINDL